VAEIRSVTFYADGLKLDGDLYLPDGIEDEKPRAALVVLSGYTGTKTGVPSRWCPTFVERGYICLGIDYRGFGESEGAHARLWPQEMVEDVRAAVSFLEQQPEVDPERIGLFGWAQGGAVAIVEAADDERVKATVTVHAQGDTGRVTKRLHTEESWAALQERLADDRRARAVTGESTVEGPFGWFPLDPGTNQTFSTGRHRPGYGAYDTQISLDSAEASLRFRAEEFVHEISPRALFLIHGGANVLHLPEESERLYERAGEPKELWILEGLAHLGWADDPEERGRVADRIDAFYRKAFG
jgi:dipeptidyl aminopeptidase/acylaminoacyl peptidase